MRKMKFCDVNFERCEEYNPFSPRANKLGMCSFWRADYYGDTIATACRTKAECVAEVRRYIRAYNK